MLRGTRLRRLNSRGVVATRDQRGGLDIIASTVAAAVYTVMVLRCGPVNLRHYPFSAQEDKILAQNWN
jgi:hypothetical protein